LEILEEAKLSQVLKFGTLLLPEFQRLLAEKK